MKEMSESSESTVHQSPAEFIAISESAAPVTPTYRYVKCCLITGPFLSCIIHSSAYRPGLFYS